jgi:hypothetical protein
MRRPIFSRAWMTRTSQTARRVEDWEEGVRE